MKILDNLFGNVNLKNNSYSVQDNQRTVFNITNEMNAASNTDNQIVSRYVTEANGEEATRIADVLKKNNMPLNRENLNGINQFMKNTEGTFEEKLQAIDMTAQKGIDLTEKNLTDVHTALNDAENASEAMETLTDTQKNPRAAERKLVANSELPKELKDQITALLDKGVPLKEAVLKVSKDSMNADFKLEDGIIKMTQNGESTYITVQEFLKNMEQSIKEAESEFRNSVGNADSEGKTLLDYLTEAEKERAASTSKTEADSPAMMEVPRKEAVGLSKDDGEQNGMEVENDEFINDALESVVDALSGLKDQLIEENEAYENIIHLLETNLEFKTFMVKEVTEKIAEVKDTFKAFQKELSASLSMIEDGAQQMNAKDLEQLVGKAIDKLDNILLKSDITLYTDMKTEKELLLFSSDLAEARNLMSQGNIKEAMKIVSHVKTQLNNVIFNPADVKIQSFATERAMQLMDDATLGGKLSFKPSGELSSRNVLEFFRNMGLNHEYEASETLLSSKGDKEKYFRDENIKEVLYKLLKEEDSKDAIKGIEKSLSNLNGQQLLNKQDGKNSQQTMFFNIPFGSQDQIKNMKLFVNSRKNGDKIDWENCSMYFVMDLKNYGTTGIRVEAKEKNLSITVRNNDVGLKEAINPMIDGLTAELGDIGYKTGKVNFIPLDDDMKFGFNPMKEQPVSKPAQKDDDENTGFSLKV